MKFIVDAQLPYQLAIFLNYKGFNAIHTDDLPDKERTTDNEIREIATNDLFAFFLFGKRSLFSFISLYVFDFPMINPASLSS